MRLDQRLTASSTQTLRPRFGRYKKRFFRRLRHLGTSPNLGVSLLTSYLIRYAMHTVGLLSHNGHVGGSILPHLIKAQQSGLIRLIVLHRASSDLTTVPDNIEKREITLDEAHIASLKSAVAGIHIVM